MALIDSYAETNQDDVLNLQDNHPSDSAIYNSAGGQAFTSPESKYKLTTVKFYLKKSQSPTGNGIMRLYAATGTVGTNATPTGSALASTGTLDISTLTTSYVLYELTFTTAYELATNTDYCLVFENPASGVDQTNYPIMGLDVSSPSHGGNMCWYANGAWNGANTSDVCFYLYGTTEEGAFLLNFI